MRGKLVRFIIALFVISAFLTGGYIYAETIDRIVAVVNDQPITQSELDALLVPIYEQYRSAYSGSEFMEKMNEARTNLLNQLIEDRLVAQEAVRLGVEVTEEEINAQVQELKSKFETEDEFFKFLETQKMTLDRLREKYKEQVAIRKLHQYEVRQKVVVSPKDIEDYYNEHIKDYTEKEKVKVKTIMLKKAENDEGFQAHMQMEKIVDDLKNGASFSEYAKQYSQGTNAAEGGDLGFVKQGELISTFDEVLFSLPVGSLSPILETKIGYHIFMIEAKQEKKVKPMLEVKDEIYNILFRNKSKERFVKWMQQLKENAYISIK